jgi:hypothetical protein
LTYELEKPETDDMPSLLRSRLALLLLLGTLLIPVWVSSLRGLTHVLTCREVARTPFTISVPADGDPLIATSIRLERDQALDLCDGLALDLGARPGRGNEVVMVVPITNQSENPWRGSVALRFGEVSIPVAIGLIGPGETVSDEVRFELDPGEFELEGTLLIGP